ncbi:MAG: PorV/PorQ family protein [Saprospiraceae bacterium]|nr:PorV/PorQ family protein [Saprospiraceae bacterium]MBK8632348.1 PorV/PorQ family protein [Saprospiraceae bacterium]HMS70113.1 PorV/PorQ family protein [Saprospiraceae bacterium]
MKRNLLIATFSTLMSFSAIAGNPDRQGESGASELLFNPWARSSGLHSLNTSSVMGVEAMNLNIAGLSRILKGEVLLANNRIFEGTGLQLNSGGYATKMGSNGTFGISISSLSFGDIEVTTSDQPEGTGGTYSPNFFNIGLGYSYMYANKISVGLLVRGVSEALPDITAFGFSIDAGVQYVSGDKENFRLGISLRNIGSPMKFSGQGLAFQGPNEDPSVSGNQYNLTYYQRSEGFQLPSLLNIGISYDWYLADKTFLRAMGNFTSNTFARDEIGGGMEFSFKDMFMLRGGYRYTLKQTGSAFQNDVYTGVSAGASILLPLSKGADQKFGIDYAYRATNPFRGTHNLSLRFVF